MKEIIVLKSTLMMWM